MNTYTVTLKRTLYCTVAVQANSAAEARKSLQQDEDTLWMKFNEQGNCHTGEETKIVSIKLEGDK